MLEKKLRVEVSKKKKLISMPIGVIVSGGVMESFLLHGLGCLRGGGIGRAAALSWALNDRGIDPWDSDAGGSSGAGGSSK